MNPSCGSREQRNLKAPSLQTGSHPDPYYHKGNTWWEVSSNEKITVLDRLFLFVNRKQKQKWAHRTQGLMWQNPHQITFWKKVNQDGISLHVLLKRKWFEYKCVCLFWDSLISYEMNSLGTYCARICNTCIDLDKTTTVTKLTRSSMPQKLSIVLLCSQQNLTSGNCWSVFPPCRFALNWMSHKIKPQRCGLSRVTSFVQHKVSKISSYCAP